MCRCSRQVASIIERIDLGCGSDLMGVFICLTAPLPIPGCCNGVGRSKTHGRTSGGTDGARTRPTA